MESEEVFEAYARIDCSNFLIQKAYDSMEIGVTTQEHVDNIIELMEGIIKDKKFIGADTLLNEKYLNQVKALKGYSKTA